MIIWQLTYRPVYPVVFPQKISIDITRKENEEELAKAKVKEVKEKSLQWIEVIAAREKEQNITHLAENNEMYAIEQKQWAEW